MYELEEGPVLFARVVRTLLSIQVSSLSPSRSGVPDEERRFVKSIGLQSPRLIDLSAASETSKDHQGTDLF